MKKLYLISVLILSGCVATTQKYIAPPMTDKQIMDVNDAALCSLSNTNIDPRISTEINSRKLDCEPTSLTCAAKGIKKGTKKFSQCKEAQQVEYALQAKKRSNPAFGYCIDSGFKTGTDAMATCMTAYNQERHNQFMFERQQDQRRDEMSQRAEEERRRSWNETLQNNNDRMMESFRRNHPPPITLPTVGPTTTTNCSPDGFGGMSCSTY